MILRHVFIICLTVLFFASFSLSAYSTLSRSEKFFDLNEDGFLNLYERNLIVTHKRFGWPLAKTRKQRKFDLNHNHLLEPEELAQYQKEKSTSSIKTSKKSLFYR